MDWFLYDRDLRYKRVNINNKRTTSLKPFIVSSLLRFNMYQVILTLFVNEFIRMVGSNKTFFQTKVRSVQTKSVLCNIHFQFTVNFYRIN